MPRIVLSGSGMVDISLLFTHGTRGGGEAGGHKPQHFSLLCHTWAFLFSGSHKPQPFCPIVNAYSWIMSLYISLQHKLLKMYNVL